MAKGHGPQRTCVGCRRVAPPSELIRVVSGPDGQLLIGRHHPGRGVWLCAHSPLCVVEANRRNGLARALRVPVTAEAAAMLRMQVTERARI